MPHAGLPPHAKARACQAFSSVWIGKAGVDCFDWAFFLFLPRLPFFLFLFISVIFVLDGMVPP
jgi:hypothetical protein